MVWATAAFDPWPISTIAMTAATPMTMPSVVRADRMILRLRALRARRSTLISTVMTHFLRISLFSPVLGGEGSGMRGGYGLHCACKFYTHTTPLPRVQGRGEKDRCGSQQATRA